MGQRLQVQGRAHSGQQQGMAGFQQMQPVLAQIGQDAVAQGGPAQQGQGLVGVGLEQVPTLEVEPACAQAVQQVAQEGVHGLGVFLVGLHVVVVQLDRLERFQEHGGAGAGAVQHQPGHHGPAFHPHGQALASVAFHHVGFLDGFGAVPQDFLQAALHRLETAGPGPVAFGQAGHLHGVQLAVLGEAAGQLVGQGHGIGQQLGRHLKPVDAQFGALGRRPLRRPGQGRDVPEQDGAGAQALPQLPPVFRLRPAGGIQNLVQGLVEGHHGQGGRIRRPERAQFHLPQPAQAAQSVPGGEAGQGGPGQACARPPGHQAGEGGKLDGFQFGCGDRIGGFHGGSKKARKAGLLIVSGSVGQDPINLRSWARRLRVFFLAASILRLRLALGFS